MNKRIGNLAEQAGFNLIQHGDHTIYDISTKENLKEFAELIVRECVMMADEFELDVNQSGLVDRMKKHFGVE
jgi:hypothetical protein